MHVFITILNSSFSVLACDMYVGNQKLVYKLYRSISLLNTHRLILDSDTCRRQCKRHNYRILLPLAKRLLNNALPFQDLSSINPTSFMAYNNLQCDFVSCGSIYFHLRLFQCYVHLTIAILFEYVKTHRHRDHAANCHTEICQPPKLKVFYSSGIINMY